MATKEKYITESKFYRETKLIRSEFRKEIASVRSELKQEIASVRSELKQEIALVRSDLSLKILRIDSELQVVKEQMATKDDIRLILNAIDAFTGKVENFERKIVFYGDRIMNHEERISKLEKDRPK